MYTGAHRRPALPSFVFFFSSRRRHTRWTGDWSSDVCSSDLDPVVPTTPRRLTGTVEFDHVTFRYPGGEKPVLEEISFRLEPGQTTAIIGGTGSGKTTVLNLIPRFFDVSEGAVLIDGTDVREQALEQVWSRVGLVPQRAYLFSGTVASNLRFGNEDASDEDLWHALEVAQARDFVEEMP